MNLYGWRLFPVLFSCALLVPLQAQEQSVRPGINDSFRDPNVNEFIQRFEIESREVYLNRQAIVAACQIKPGETIADIGAGTGLFTRLFAKAVGPEGRVLAVDIAQKFLDHIAATSREQGLLNVETVLCTPDSTALKPNSIDLAFICDTYHHFEFPQKTLASLHRALRPGGRVVLIDFRRVEGESSEWVLNHVRAGQEVFEQEIMTAGFSKIREERELLKENYLVVFQKIELALDEHQPRNGRGMGRGRGPDPELRQDQDVFHYLLEHHDQITRKVTLLENGVETLTESADPEVASKLREHVAAMHKRVVEGRGLRFWDELFAAVFSRYRQIQMEYEETESGVRVRETSTDPFTVKLIQAHAEVVSRFVKYGFDEAHENHPVPALANVVAAPAPAGEKPALVTPVVQGYGAILPRPQAVEQPRPGAKVVLDITLKHEPGELNKGIERAARLLNLYGANGLKAGDVQIAIVLHGDATPAVLSNAAVSTRFQLAENPNLPLIAKLRESGVDVQVCGQALNYKGIADTEVAEGISIAASALTALINKQAEGYAYIMIH